MRYKVILKTSHKHTARVENCLVTWLGDLDYVCLTDRLTGKFNEISGSDDDSYTSNEEKTITLLNLIRETDYCSEYDWLIFIDDDAILNAKYFEHLIPHLDKSLFYGLGMGGHPKRPEIVFPSGGAGYFVSPQLIKILGKISKPDWSTGGTEDVIVGNWLQENNRTVSQPYLKDTFVRLNGWWPFHREKDSLAVEDQESPNLRNLVVEKALQSDYSRDFILSHLTHHYLREPIEMEYVYNILKDWTPQYLLACK